MIQNTTESIRVSSELMEKIRKICKQDGYSYTGYITASLTKSVNRDYQKLLTKIEKNATKIHS